MTANHHDHSGRWPQAAAAFEQLHAKLDESPNSGWIRGASTVQRIYVRKLLGRYALLRAELPERLASARDLGIRHEQVSLACLTAHIHAIYGELEPAERLLADARERWRARQITFQHVIIEMTEHEIALLAGDTQRALAAAERVLGDFRAKIVASMMPSHVEFHELRGRSRVRAALAGVDISRSLARVRKDLVKLRRSHKPQVGAQALALEAAVHCCEGDWAGAEARWREAKAEFERLALHGHVAAVAARLAELGDAEAEAEQPGRARGHVGGRAQRGVAGRLLVAVVVGAADHEDPGVGLGRAVDPVRAGVHDALAVGRGVDLEREVDRLGELGGALPLDRAAGPALTGEALGRVGALALDAHVARGVVVNRAGALALDELADEAVDALIGLVLAAGREAVGVGDLGDQLAVSV